MPALNFKKEFAEAVRTGQKKQTIRAMRKYPIHKDDKLYLYTGMRTKACEKLGEAVASEVDSIQIWPDEDISINGEVIPKKQARQLTIDDGFGCLGDFYDFFNVACDRPFTGQLIKWEELK